MRGLTAMVTLLGFALAACSGARPDGDLEVSPSPSSTGSSSSPVASASASAESLEPPQSASPEAVEEVGIVATFTFSSFTGEYMPKRECEYFADAEVVVEDGEGIELGSAQTSGATGGFGGCSVMLILQIPRAPVYVLRAFLFESLGVSRPLNLVYTDRELRRSDYRFTFELRGE